MLTSAAVVVFLPVGAVLGRPCAEKAFTFPSRQAWQLSTFKQDTGSATTHISSICTCLGFSSGIAVCMHVCLQHMPAHRHTFAYMSFQSSGECVVIWRSTAKQRVRSGLASVSGHVRHVQARLGPVWVLGMPAPMGH